MTLFVDSGGLSWLAGRSRPAIAYVDVLLRQGLWPPVVPTVVLAESLSGLPRTDVPVDRLLSLCDVRDSLPAATARRAGTLRRRAGRGSAVDAILVAMAEPGGTVLTSDEHDLGALAADADDVRIQVV